VSLAGIEAVGADIRDSLGGGGRYVPVSQTNPVHQSGALWNYLGRNAGPHGAQFLNDLRTGGPQQVADYDVMFRRGALDRIIADPNASPLQKQQAHYFEAHPYQAGAFDFVTEFFNPGTYAGGEAVNLAMRGGGLGFRTLRALSPELDAVATAVGHSAHAVGQPLLNGLWHVGRATLAKIPGGADVLRALVDRYYNAGLPQRGGLPFVTAALAAHMYPEYQAGQAVRFIRELGQGLTLAQKRELQRLSYVDASTGERLAARNPAIPEPQGASLATRAHNLRQWMMQRDVEQNNLGIRDVHQGEQYDSGLFWPMRQFDENSPVYQPRNLTSEEGAAANDEVTAQQASRRIGGRSRYASTVPNSRRKTISTILNPGVESALHPEYDPIYQLEQHYGQTVRAIANEQVKRDLEHLPSVVPGTGVQRTENIPGEGEQPLYARMPAHYALHEPSGEQIIFGQGATGRVARERYIRNVVSARSAAQARANPEMQAAAEAADVRPESLGTRAVVRKSVAPSQARVSEARAGEKLVGKLAGGITGPISRVQSEVGERARVLYERHAALEDAGQSALGRLDASGRRIVREHAEAARAAGHTGSYTTGEGVTQISAGTPERAGYGYTKAEASALRRALSKAGTKVTDDEAEGLILEGLGRLGERVVGAPSVAKVASSAAASEEAFRAAATVGKLTKARAAAEGLGQAAAQRVSTATQEFVNTAARTQVADQFNRLAQRYYHEIYQGVAEDIREQSTRVPAGYELESKLRIGSPTSRDMALDSAFGNFFLQGVQAAQRGEARAAWRAYQVLNGLMRTMIVLIPTVHGINNLGMHYLAEGGNPAEMARILAGRYVASDGVEERAARAGALAQTSAMGLFGREGAHATTEAGERAGIIASHTHVPRPLVRGYLGVSDLRQRTNTWLFGKVQRGYELSLFEKFTREGMSDGEAALRVRQAMGRYDDINSTLLNSIFYFVPWMRTVIPYWAKKGVIDPRWWTAPVGATMTTNQLQGYDDPSKPFQLTMGREANGDWRLATLPLPQRVLGMEAAAARVPFDLAQPGSTGRAAALKEDVSAPLDYFSYHENPIVGLGTSLAQMGTGSAPPWNPFQVEPGQSPLPSFLEKFAASAAAPWQRIQGAIQDPWSALAYPLGSSVYPKPDAKKAAMDKAWRTALNQLGNVLTTTTDPARRAQIQQQMQTLEDRIAGKPVTPATQSSDDPFPLTHAASDPFPIDAQAQPAAAASGSVTYQDSQDEADMPNTTPQMQRAFQVLAPFAPLVTSVMHGQHEGPTSGPDEDPHYAGRAVDVGAFGGTDVGVNQVTVDALAAAIRSRQFSRIGTLLELVNDPDLQALAQANGVDLFEDDEATGASGPHMHLEVQAAP
jgi:hypothetical protein